MNVTIHKNKIYSILRTLLINFVIKLNGIGDWPNPGINIYIIVFIKYL